MLVQAVIRLWTSIGREAGGRRQLGYGVYAAFFKAALVLHWFYYLYIISECQN